MRNKQRDSVLNKYYLWGGLESSDFRSNLDSYYRIVQLPNTFPFIPRDIQGYNSLEELRKNNSLWAKLKKADPKIADKICQTQFILNCDDFILTPDDGEFREYASQLLLHAIHGKFEKEFSGLHLISNLNKNIVKIEETKCEDCNGVWEAEITVFNSTRNKEYTKVSTLFPKSWTPTHFMFENYEAVTKIKIEDSITKYESTTLSGVPVTLIIKEGKLRSIYPNYSED